MVDLGSDVKKAKTTTLKAIVQGQGHRPEGQAPRATLSREL